MASIQTSSDPIQDDLKSSKTTSPSPSSKQPPDEGFFGAFRKGISQPIKMPAAMTNFSIPIPSTTSTSYSTTTAAAAAAVSQPEPAGKTRPAQADDSRRLQQAIDEKEVAQAEISRLSGQLAELLAERQRNKVMLDRVPVLESDLDKLRSELCKIRDRADYKRMESNEIETQKMKELNQILKTELSAVKQELQSSQSHISSLTATITELRHQIDNLQRVALESDAKRSAAEQSAEAAALKASSLSGEISALISARDEALAKLSMSREAVALETRRDRDRWQTKAAEKERQFFVELDAVVADRNSWRAKAESLQVALDKSLKKISSAGESTKWGQERARLEAEIQRKAASLQDAMDALQSRDPVKKTTAIVSLEAQRRIPDLTGPDMKIMEQNPALQSLLQSFMESISNRDSVITQLQFDNAALNQKISDLALKSSKQNG